MNDKKIIKASSAEELFKKASSAENQDAKVEKIFISNKKGIFKMLLEKLSKK